MNEYPPIRRVEFSQYGEEYCLISEAVAAMEVLGKRAVFVAERWKIECDGKDERIAELEAQIALDPTSRPKRKPSEFRECEDSQAVQAANEREAFEVWAEMRDTKHGGKITSAAMGLDYPLGRLLWEAWQAGNTRQATAQPIASGQEPVGWVNAVNFFDSQKERPTETVIKLVKKEQKAYGFVYPIYAHPAPAQQPLSDMQKQRIHDETDAGHALISLVEMYIKEKP